MKNILIILPLIIFYCQSKAQTISGTVYGNENGKRETLPGVHIYWENTTDATTSDAQGKFSISQKKEHQNLVFSYVGFERKTLHVHGEEPVEVDLFTNIELGQVNVITKDKGSYLSTVNPIYVEKITGAELHKAACCNLAESFETNPSVDMSYNDAVTGAKQIKLLGLEGIYSQLQTENIANFRGLATNFGLTYIPGPWMESIQVSKGAASVVNGYESITGQINVGFKKPDSQEMLHLNTYGSTDGKLEFNANTNLRLKGNKLTTGIFVHAEMLDKKNDHNNDGFLDHPLNKQIHLFNTWKYNNEKGMFLHWGMRFLTENRQGGQVDFKKGMDRKTENPYGIGIDNNLYETNFKLGYVFPSNKTAVALLTNGVFHNLKSFYGLNNYDGDEQRFHANFVWTQDLDKYAVHTLNAGASYFYNQFDENLNLLDMNRKESVPGIFAEYTFKPSHKLTFMAGIRSDFHNLYKTFVTPRMHFRYQPDLRWTFRLSAGKGYRSANVLAENSFLLSNYRTLIFEENMQEEAWNFGASFIQQYELFGRDLQIAAEYYYTTFDKQLVTDRESNDDIITIAPLNGKSYASSWQVDVRYPVIRNFDLTLAWRQNDVKQTIGGKLLEKPLTSRYKGLITMNYTTNLKKWMFDYTIQFNGGGRLPLTSTEKLANTESEFSPFTIMNAQVTRYFRKWSVYIGAENLTDFMQKNSILGADAPFSPGFDATKIWGPTMGRKFYFGARFTLNYD
ncbi:MAG: TonB-dependent receptor [Prolixibacteraceae bacterium]|nr:TonB-dependent receptor [Prolixibacteraceae bacterium]